MTRDNYVNYSKDFRIFVELMSLCAETNLLPTPETHVLSC